MRFVYDGNELVLETVPPIDTGLPSVFELPGEILGWIGDGVGWTVEQFFKVILQLIGEGLKFIGTWIIENLPDIMGYGTIGFGGLMILSSMTKGSIMKPFAWWSGLMILSIAILGS